MTDLSRVGLIQRCQATVYEEIRFDLEEVDIEWFKRCAKCRWNNAADNPQTHALALLTKYQP